MGCEACLVPTSFPAGSIRSRVSFQEKVGTRVSIVAHFRGLLKGALLRLKQAWFIASATPNKTWIKTLLSNLTAWHQSDFAILWILVKLRLQAMLPQKRIDANLSKRLKFSMLLVGGSNPNLTYLRVPLSHSALNSRTEIRMSATGLVFKQHLLEFP